MAERRKRSSKSSNAATKGKSPVSDVTSEDAARRRAALENAVKRKIESEKRALQIVERLLEDDVTEDFLVGCARFISPAHYKDVVEERSIIKSCSYPICNKKLEHVPKQKYWISTKSNKVYDITERKCFCSNFCFRASKYFEAQIPQTPIWTREEESPPEIKLLKEGKSGRSGVEIKLSEKRVRSSDVEKFTPLEAENTYGSDSDSDSVAEPEPAFVSSIITVDGVGSEPAETREQRNGVPESDSSTTSQDTGKGLPEVTERLSLCKLSDEPNESLIPPQEEDRTTSEETRPSVNSEKSDETQIFRVTQRSVSKRGAEQLRKLLCSSREYKSSQKVQEPVVSAKGTMLEVLAQTLNEWKTEETLKRLHGSNYVVESTLSAEKHEGLKEPAEELDEDDLTLDTSDLEFGLGESPPPSGTSRAEKPAPDYGKLKEEAEILNIKVQEFFTGRYILHEQAKPEKIVTDGSTSNPKLNTAWTAALPLVDSCSQQQIRKRIVLEKLKKVLPAILLPLQITYSDVSQELHSLTRTFQFSNKNITHTTPEWSLIAIVLLSALLPTMSDLKDSQQNPGYTQFVSKLLEELHFKWEDLELLKRRFASNTLPQCTM